MRTIDDILSRMKSKTILDRKPNLKICSNHRKDEGPTVKRFYDSANRPPAISDGKGWYLKRR